MTRFDEIEEVRTAITEDETAGCLWVDVAAHDRHGLLVAITGALDDLDLEISHAQVATWPDGAALESFCVRAAERPDAAALRRAVEAALDAELASPPLPAARLAFDDHGSPWHTAGEVEAPDKPHLLHQLATAFTAAGVDVTSATVTGHDGRAYDSFLLDRSGERKLDAGDQTAIVRFVHGGVVTRHRWLRHPSYIASSD